jgi:hypothetical protein
MLTPLINALSSVNGIIIKYVKLGIIECQKYVRSVLYRNIIKMIG